jgi:hypothetical protein
MLRRPHVLAVLGARTAKVVAKRAANPSLSIRAGNSMLGASNAASALESSIATDSGLRPMKVLSSGERRRLSRASPPALRSPGLLLPLAAVLVLLGIPVFYVDSALHFSFIKHLVDALHAHISS